MQKSRCFALFVPYFQGKMRCMGFLTILFKIRMGKAREPLDIQYKFMEIVIRLAAIIPRTFQ